MTAETKTQELPAKKPAAPAQTPAAAYDDLGFELPEPAKLQGGRGRRLVMIALLVVAAAFCLGFLPRFFAQRALASETAAESAAIPRVELVAPSQQSPATVISSCPEASKRSSRRRSTRAHRAT